MFFSFRTPNDEPRQRFTKLDRRSEKETKTKEFGRATFERRRKKRKESNDRANEDRRRKRMIACDDRRRKRNEKRSCEDRRKVRDSGFAGFEIRDSIRVSRDKQLINKRLKIYTDMLSSYFAKNKPSAMPSGIALLSSFSFTDFFSCHCGKHNCH